MKVYGAEDSRVRPDTPLGEATFLLVESWMKSKDKGSQWLIEQCKALGMSDKEAYDTLDAAIGVSLLYPDFIVTGF